MAKRNIEDNNPFWNCLKRYNKFIFYRYFKKIEIHGLENLPKNEAVIFASNHQNALIDPLVIHATQKDQVIYLTRSDVFENKILNKILTFLKMLPIYRIRDGIKSLSRNEEVFNKTINILIKKKKIGILPEGNHAGFRKLRALKKGIARIAFKAAEKTDFKLNVKIIPVGIDYTNYLNIKSNLLVNYGVPIELTPFYESYKENPQKGMKLFISELKRRLIEEMIHISDNENYEAIEDLRRIYTPTHINHKNKKNILLNTFKADKILIDKIINIASDKESEIKDIKSLLNDYKQNLKKLNFRDWVIRKGNFNFIYIILNYILFAAILPIHIYGVINNYLAYKIPVWSVKNIKDIIFHSSVKYAIVMFLFPIMYALQFTIVALCTDIFWIKWVYLISLPITGQFSIMYYIANKKLFAKLKFTILKWSKNKLLLETISQHQSIISSVDKLIK